MPALSYDLHVHPGPSRAPRWGTGEEVQRAAEEAGVRGFVWKAHEQHTPQLCAALPESDVRAFGSASLNDWASLDDVLGALADGARWLWGPTVTPAGETAWELELPPYWPELAIELARRERRLVVATGHLAAPGRRAFAELAATTPALLCSVTHTLYVPLPELLDLAELGAVFELDGYTFTHELPGRTLQAPGDAIDALEAAGALVYFTSDGGQASTGNPFAFGAEALEQLGAAIGEERAEQLGQRNPALVVAWLDGMGP